MKKSRLTPISAKKKLIEYHNYRPSDFYDTTLICQDNIELSAKDVYEELQLQLREQYDDGR